MKKGLFKVVAILFLILFTAFQSGCSVRFYRGNPEDLDAIDKLKSEIAELEGARDLLESRFKDEIKNKQVKVDLTDRGLVITLVDEILFDSGKVDLRQDAPTVLDKVASVIIEKVPSKYVGIEGHTDNEPIKYSSWKSNWDLSAARATTVLHYLEDAGVKPSKMRATGFGEYRPVESNDTKAGRQQNRRVEIVILPDGFDKVDLKEREENQTK